MPKPSIAQTLLVMMRTFSARLRVLTRSSIGLRSRTRARACEGLGAAHRSLAAEAGDTLLEVLVSALLLGLIVVGTFSGLNSANRATSIDRSRSQADALAEHAEEQLRSEPIKRLVELTESHPLEEHVEENHAKYTIVSTAQYISDATSTSSCTSSSAKADYIQTTSKVSTPLIGAGKSVEENGIISPPAGSALIVQVGESGTPLQGAKVLATGPSPASTPYELETSANGCAILAVPPGEYNIYVSKTSYVDPNGYENTHEDSSTTRSVYIPAENTSKVGYNLGLASTLQVKFIEGSAATPTEGDSFVAFNTGMTKPRPFPIPFTPGSYGTTVPSTPTIFPFKTKYAIYAGTCEADLPSANGVPLVAAEEQEVAPGSTKPVTVRLGPVNIRVMSGYSSAFQGEEIGGATGYTNDTGCGVKRTFTTNSTAPIGAMPHPGLPFGKYMMCVGATIAGVEKKWETTSPFENNSIVGPLSTNWTNGKTNGSGIAIIYLGLKPTGSPSGAGTVSLGHC
jgi:Tfp pilus assembly protein PilV